MKTPLQMVRSDLSRLMAASDAADRTASAHAIDRTIDLANARLHSLMQLFRLESMVAIPMDQLDLSLTAEYAVDDIADALTAKDRRLTVRIERGIRVLANRNLIELLIGNLLSNANKYAVPGSQIIVTLVRDAGRFRLSVANTGTSFPPELRMSAFDRFSRGRSTDDVPGAGIGLSLVKSIALRHGYAAEITPSNAIAEIVISGDCTETE
jgi:signal transduction histidine kinase